MKTVKLNAIFALMCGIPVASFATTGGNPNIGICGGKTFDANIESCCGDDVVGTIYHPVLECCDDSSNTTIEKFPTTPPTCVNVVPTAGTNWTQSIPVNIVTTEERPESCGEYFETIVLENLTIIYRRYTIDTYTTTGTLSVPYQEEYVHYQSTSSGCGEDFTGSSVNFAQPGISWNWGFGVSYGAVGISVSPSIDHDEITHHAGDVSSTGDYRRLIVDIYKRRVKPAGDGSFSGTVSVVYGCNPPNTSPLPQTHENVIGNLVTGDWRVESLRTESCDVECCPGG